MSPSNLTSLVWNYDKWKGTYPSLYHTRVQPSISQLYPSVCPHVVCVCVIHSTRGRVRLAEWAPHITWMEETMGRDDEWHKPMDEKREVTYHSFWHVCVRPHSASLLSVIHVNMCGPHSTRGMYPLSFIHMCDPIQPAAPFPRASMFCACVAPIQPEEGYGCFNGCHTARVHETRVRLVQWWPTHMDDWGKGYAPFSLSCTCATPIQLTAPSTLSPMLCMCVCDTHSTRGRVQLVVWAPHTWMNETMGKTGEWGHKHMDDKVKDSYPSLCHTLVRPIHPAVSFSLSSVCVRVCVSVIQPEEGYGWLTGWYTQHGWQGERVCTYVSVMDLCDPHSASHVFCVTIQPLCVCRRVGVSRLWLVGWAPHTIWMEETRGMAVEWGLKHMHDKGKGTYSSLCHTRVQPSISQMYPSICPHVVCVLHSTRGRVRPAEWVPHTTWVEETMGRDDEWHKPMDEKREVTYHSFWHVCVRPHSASPSLCNSC